MDSWSNSGITPQNLERALARLEEAFLDSPGPEALLARRETGRGGAADESALEQCLDDILDAQDGDGGWRGELVATSASLLWLAELTGTEPPEQVRAAAARGVAWLRRLRGAAGRFGQGCSPERHRLGFCHHYLGGIFAPEPPITPDEELILPGGARVPAGPAASLAASCLALLACLRWGDRGADAWLHLDGLRRLITLEPRDATPLLQAEALPAAVHALLAVPERAELQEAAAEALGRITQSQRADGSWPELDARYVLEVLLAADAAGHGSPAIDAAIRRGAGLLAVTQQQDGLWERDAPPRRVLIGWLVLRHAVQRDRERSGAEKGDD